MGKVLLPIIRIDLAYPFAAPWGGDQEIPQELLRGYYARVNQGSKKI